jgi:hypothetical protein
MHVLVWPNGPPATTTLGKVHAYFIYKLTFIKILTILLNINVKDFFGKELVVGDIIALLQKAGSSSVYIRSGVVTGFTPKQVKVRFSNQFGGEDDSTREPCNVIKRD